MELSQGDAYKAHTSCISEAEKYQGSLYKGGKAAKKNPQERWTDALHSAASKAEGSQAKLFESLLEFPNVPRKKTKFLNFARNSLKIHSEPVLNQLFEAISAEFGSNDDSSGAAAGSEGGSTTAATGGTKRPREETQAADAITSTSGSKWQQLVVQVLQDAPKRTMRKKSLRKSVAAAAGVEDDDKKMKKGFKKALESMADFRLISTKDKDITLL